MNTTPKNLFNLAVTVLVLLILSGNEASSEPVEKPNIIYILADDLGYGDLSMLGQTHFSTPNIDKLAKEGLFFTQHYSGSTVCAPSRSALMTGLHTGHTYIRGNHEVQPEGQWPLPASAVTLPQLLKEAGYVTGAFGKWGLGYPGSEGDPMHHFDRFYGYNCQRYGHHYYPHHLWDDDQRVSLDENAGFTKGQYAPELIQKNVLDFIQENKDRPFFCYVPTIIPHAELAAPEIYMKQFRGKFGTETPWEGTDFGDDYRTGPYESQAEPRAAFAAMVAYLDHKVGEIVSKIDELGLSERTLIIFTSDNGPHEEAGADPEYFNSNGPFRGVKRDLYEGGIHVPMIARWTGVVDAGTKSDHISAFWDVLPTLADLAGFEVSEKVDGVSFAPALLGNPSQQKEHDYLYWEFHERGGRVAIRKGDWKAVRYDVLETPDAPMELYNLAKDPGESSDVSSKHPGIVDEMTKLFQEARTESDVFSFGQRGYLQDD